MHPKTGKILGIFVAYPKTEQNELQQPLGPTMIKLKKCWEFGKKWISGQSASRHVLVFEPSVGVDELPSNALGPHFCPA